MSRTARSWHTRPALPAPPSPPEPPGCHLEQPPPPTAARPSITGGRGKLWGRGSLTHSTGACQSQGLQDQSSEPKAFMFHQGLEGPSQLSRQANTVPSSPVSTVPSSDLGGLDLGGKGLPCLHQPLKGREGSRRWGAGLGLGDTGESKVSFWGRSNLDNRSEGLLYA